MQTFENPLAIAATVAMGGSIVLLTITVTRALQLAQADDGGPWRYDVNRMNTLRAADPWYRLFEPLVQGLAQLNRGLFAPSLPPIGRDMVLAGVSRMWLAEEYLARMQLLALLLLPLYIGGGLWYFGGWGVALGLMLGVATLVAQRQRLRGQALRRQQLIKRQLPFLLDLLTLLMYAGISFMQALRTRLDDDDVSALVGAILQSEQLGSPLAEVLRTQADVLRLKRSQRAETLAGEAGVNMLLPAVLVMAATVLIILGPFVLNIFVLAWEL
jgi:tight adherence protein C